LHIRSDVDSGGKLYCFQQTAFLKDSWQRFYFKLQDAGLPVRRISEKFITFRSFGVSDPSKPELARRLISYSILFGRTNSDPKLTIAIQPSADMTKKRIVSIPILRNEIYCVESHLLFFPRKAWLSPYSSMGPKRM